MTIITSIKGENAAFAWCPMDTHKTIVAIASKEGSISGFDDNKGTLQVYDFDINHTDGPKLLASLDLENRVTSLCWGKTLIAETPYPYGILAASFANGSIALWEFVMNEESIEIKPITTIQITQCPVKCLCFNPHVWCKQMACGSQDGTLTLVDLFDMENPILSTFTSQTGTIPAEITKVCWNTKVSHILSCCQINGHITLWDIRQKTPWCELCDPNNSRISDMIWNPTDGLQLITCVENDTHPFIRLWDLRSSTSTPFLELSGHTKGVLSVSWCPYDPTLLLSCGKDNKVLLWNIATSSLAEEIDGIEETKVAPQDAQLFFTNTTSASVIRKTQVEWSPLYPGIACVSSTDRSITLYNIMAPAPQSLHRAPVWMQQPCGAIFGFGGKIASFDSTSKIVKVSTFIPDSSLIEESHDFEEAMNTGDLKGFCEKRCTTENQKQLKDMWHFMNSMFEEDARDALVRYLGYSQPLSDIPEEQPEEKPTEVVSEIPKMPAAPAISAEDLFSKPLEISSTTTTPTPSSPVSLISTQPLPSGTPIDSLSIGTASVKEMDESTWLNDVRLCIVCGNFEGAVNICYKNQRFGDALLIASWGGNELLTKTQSRYMTETFPSVLRPFSSIVRGDLSSLVSASSLEDWKDTLVMILTYGKAEEFVPLCQDLSKKLEDNHYVDEALLCSICAMDLPSVVRLGLKSNVNKDIDDLVPVLEVISILTHMQQEEGEQLPELDPSLLHNVITLSTSLVNQGLASMATRFIRSIGASEEGELLLYRIYQSYPEALNGYIPKTPLPLVQQQPMIQQQQVAPQQVAPQQVTPQQVTPQQQNNVPSYSRFPAAATQYKPMAPKYTPLIPQVTPSIPASATSPSIPTVPVTTPAPTPMRPTAFIPTPTIAPLQPSTTPTPTAPPAPSSRAPVPMDMSKLKTVPYVPSVPSVTPSIQPTNLYTNPVPEPIPEPAPEPVFREMTADEQSVVDSIRNTISMMEQVPLNASQKTVINNTNASINTMENQFKHDEVSEGALTLLLSMKEYLNNFAFNDALNIQKKLNLEYWKQHKEWLLPLKHFIMLCIKLSSGN
ncbi:hypothetical protein WA158_006721 [Blastocystis sp. Blastoise]